MSDSPSGKTGHTSAGEDFRVPETADMFHTLASPSKCGPAELLTHFTLFLTFLSLFLIPYLPLAFYIFAFAFWRVSYNLGLGLLLHHQSKHQTITKWLVARSPSARSLLHWVVAKPVTSPYSWAAVPASFNAWLVFRALSTLILANDGWSYAVLAFACFRPFADSRLSTVLVALPVGVALLILSFWSKAAAHKALGDYAWFWGDFFFTVDSKLVLEGVFELFPHPMYTVGYAGYYGLALLCRSYTLLLLSLLAHSAQLAFLAFVEEPHIRKIYGPKPLPSVEKVAESATAPEEAIGMETSEATASSHDKFVASAPQLPVLIAICALTSTLLLVYSFSPVSAPVILCLFAIWRVCHWIGCATFLTKAEGSTENRWMRWCLAHGSSREQAYSSWQHVFLLSYVMNHTLFILAVRSLPGADHSSSSLAKDWSLVLAGLSLTVIAAVSMISAWSDTGYFTFFYGDFFVTPKSRELQYNGAYRYVTHPEASLGYLAYYGIAIMRQSQILFLIALICQVLHLLFISWIEQIHVAREYKFVRRRTALESSIESLPLVGALLTSTRRVAMHFAGALHHSRENHYQLLHDRFNMLKVQKEKLHADLNKKSLTIWNRHVVSPASELKEKAKSKIDCEKVILLLEKKGVVVERVEDQ